MDPLSVMLSVTDSTAFPENRLKVVLNKHNVQICLSGRSEAILQGADSFSDKLQETFLKRQFLDHLSTFHDGGTFTLRLTKFLLEAAATLEIQSQIVAKMLAFFRKVALEQFSKETSSFTVRFDFETCKPLIDFTLSVITSKQLICPRSCSHQNDCESLELAVTIVRCFLQSIDAGPGNVLKILPFCRGQWAPSLSEGLTIKAAKEEVVSMIETWNARRQKGGDIRCVVFCESPPLFGNPVDSEDKNLAKDCTCRFGVSYDSFKEKYCIEITESFQSLGIEVVFCQKFVEEELIFQCSRHSILVIDRIGDEDCIYLQTFLGTTGSIWPDSPGTAIDLLNIGSLKDLKLTETSPKRCLVSLTRSSPTNFRTLVISAPIEGLLPDIKALCECALSGLKLTMMANHGIVLKGAGLWQIEMANCVFKKINGNLDNLVRELGLSRGQIMRCLVAFCSALARTGLKVDKTLVSRLRPELSSSCSSYAILDDEKITSSASSFTVFDCFLMARSAFDTAVCSALTLISTDKFIGEHNTRRFLENSKQLSR